MDIWWHSLVLPLQLFYGIGIIAGIVLVIEVLLTLLGMNHHSDLSGISTDHPDQLGMLSVRTITGFFFGFGWAGVIAIRAGLGVIGSALIACVVGFIFLLGNFFLMRALFSLRGSGTLDYKNAIGKVATVYVTVPASRGGGGQIEVLIQGRLQMIACLTSHPISLLPQTKVKVTGLVDQGTLEVEPL